MSPPFNPRLSLQLARCLPDPETQAEGYVADLVRTHPEIESSPLLQNYRDCFRRSHRAVQCLPALEPSSPVGDLCNGERPSLGSLYELVEGDARSDSSLRFALRNLISFSIHQAPIPGPVAGSLVSRLVPPNEISSQYQGRNPPRLASNPNLCSNAQDWVRHDLLFEGLARPISVFVSQEQEPGWPAYEMLVRGGIEILKRILEPQSLENLIHPDQGPDLSYYFARFDPTRVPGSDLETAAQNCGMIRLGGATGRYQHDQRRVTLFSATPLHDFESWSRLREHPQALDEEERLMLLFQISSALGDFFHETGHAIHHSLLESNLSFVTGLAFLFNWSNRQSSLTESGLWPVSGIEAAILPSIGSSVGRPYSATNEMEYFAVAFSTYVESRIGARYQLSALELARNRLFDGLFAGGGIHPEAWATPRIQAAYREQGADYRPIVWVPQIRTEAFFGSNVHLGGSLYVGAQHSLFNIGFGGQIRFQSPFAFAPHFSVEAEGALGFPLRFEALTLGLQGLLRAGIQIDPQGAVPIFGLGARLSFAPRNARTPGSSFVLSGVQEFNPLRGQYPFYGTLGWAHAF